MLIGVYDLATGKPLMGVVGRPFSPSTKVKSSVADPDPNPDPDPPEPNVFGPPGSFYH